ncbi:MAG: DUF2292 domain-containing protein [Planctomycetaceae bacterium]
MEDEKQTRQQPAEDSGDQDIAEIRNALRGIRYGSLLVVVQDGVVVQIDRTEKHRIRPARAGNERTKHR